MILADTELPLFLNCLYFALPVRRVSLDHLHLHTIRLEVSRRDT